MIKHKISKAYIDNNILYIEDELHNSVNISSSGKIVGGPDITIGYQSVAIIVEFENDENWHVFLYDVDGCLIETRLINKIKNSTNITEEKNEISSDIYPNEESDNIIINEMKKSYYANRLPPVKLNFNAKRDISDLCLGLGILTSFVLLITILAFIFI